MNGHLLRCQSALRAHGSRRGVLQYAPARRKTSFRLASTTFSTARSHVVVIDSKTRVIENVLADRPTFANLMARPSG